MPTSLIPEPLIETNEFVFDKCGLEVTNLIKEKESAEYSAYQFELNGLKTVFRTAKITPTKLGQFVTLWKRIQNGPIQPFENSDDVELFIINTKTENHFGQFIFPKAVLSQHEIVTNGTKEGKRAIRVYPPWDKTISKQAQKTQQWQLAYFLEIPLDKPIDLSRAKLLYNPHHNQK